MSDVFDAPTRSRVMAAVRSKDTTPEIKVRKALHAAGYRFRLHRKDLPGKPDIVLPRHRMAVFVHGCFWHGHGCSRAKRPAANAEYWEAKLTKNMQRDRDAQERLQSTGWRVAVVWTCRLEADIESVLARLASGED